MNSLREDLIKGVIQKEGGYSNDPSDSGGETRFGITHSIAKIYGYEGPMSSMPIEIAEKIYTEKYWHSMKLDLISQYSEILVEKLFDIAVNMGVYRSATFLQRSLNVMNNKEKYYADVQTDGLIGNKTLQALNSFVSLRQNDGVSILIMMLKSLQGAFYINLAEDREKDEKFIYGWFKNRV